MFHLPSAKPHDMGIPPEAVRRFLQTLNEQNWGLHSFILVRHGYTVTERWAPPYAMERPHLLHSLTKSFTGIAVGFAVQEGLCSVDDYLIDFFPEKLDCEPCGNMRKLRIRHLLSMSTGHSTEPEHHNTRDLVKNFLHSYLEHEPGTHFLYNTYASHILGCLVEKLSGQHLDDYLAPRLFEPLGFGEYHWQRSPEGACYGGYGLSLQTRDIAKFGQFLLQTGRWGGKQILDEAWVKEATGEHIRQEGNSHPDWTSGYGYQFWRCSYPGAFRGDGAFGQFCVLFPEEDMVVAMTAGTADMHVALETLYDTLLPALSGEALPPDEEAQSRLDGLQLRSEPLPGGASGSPLTKKIDGAIYRLHNGDRLCLNSGDADMLHWRHAGEAFCIPLSYGSWGYAGAHDPGNPYAEHLSAAAWHDENTLLLTVLFHNTPQTNHFEFRFIDSAVYIREKKTACFDAAESEYFGIREDALGG